MNQQDACYNLQQDYSENNNYQPTAQNVDKVIRTTHLNNYEKEWITKTCLKYYHVLQFEQQQLTSTSKVKDEIRLKEEEPVFPKTYRYPFVHRQEIQRQIEEMLIRPSDNPWSSPVWIVAKKADASGKKKSRMIIDYRKLIEKTISNKYPLFQT